MISQLYFCIFNCRESPGPPTTVGNSSHDGPKKKRVESPKLQPDKPTAPSTSTKPSNNSTLHAAKTTPSTVSKPSDKSSTKPTNSVSQAHSQSPSLDNQIAAAVADEFASKDIVKPKSLQANLRMTPHRTPDPVMRQKTSNSGAKGKQAQHVDSANLSRSGKTSHVEKNADRLTPPPSRNPVKRNADATSLTNSAPPAVKYTRREVDRDEEQNSAALTDTPTSSKLSNNQRRNSLPAAVKDTVRLY